MGQSDAKQEDGTCHITEESASDLAEGFGGQMLHGNTYIPTSIFSKGCRLNPKDGVLGTPYHPFSTPNSRWSYTWLDVDNIQIHVVDFTSGGGCICFKCPPQTLGKMFNLTIICFKGFGSTTKQFTSITSKFFRLPPSHHWRDPLMEDCVNNIQIHGK